MQDPIQVVTFIIGTIVIVFGAYYLTYFLGRKASGKSRGRLRNRNINMVDRFAISKDKSFCLVEIAGKVYVVGVTNQSMTLLDTLDAAAFAETAPERNDAPAWQMPSGRQFSNRLVNRLSCFLAEKMSKTRGYGGNARTRSGNFADAMKTAGEKNTSGQPKRAQEERSDDPEGEA